MITLSFLGTGNYEQTTYVVEGKRCTTRFFSVAMNAFFKPDKLFVVMTEEARDKNAETLKELCDFEPVLVPSGRKENELWEMFQKLVEVVPGETELILDVTHGFRSQPLLALTAALYLTAARNVHIAGIYYGAWEARNPETNEAPVFDLTPLRDLIDWSAATRVFMQFGDARYLGDLLKKAHTTTYRQKESPYRAKGLAHAGNLLEQLSRALALVQPLESARLAHKLPDALNQLDEDLQNLPQTRPFGLLMEQVKNRIDPLGGDGEALFTPEGFRLQAAMIRYYLRANQFQQALTLSREALVSHITVQRTSATDPERILEKEDRKPAADFLNDLIEQARKHELPDDKKELADLWGQLRDLRNNVNHAGMQVELLHKLQERKGRTLLNKLEKNVREVCKQVAGVLEQHYAPRAAEAP